MGVGGGMNRRYKYGDVMRCILGRSVFHFAARCPSRGRGKNIGRGRGTSIMNRDEVERGDVGGGTRGGRGKRKVKGRKESVKESFMSLGVHDGNMYEAIGTILNTGCERYVMGEKFE